MVGHRKIIAPWRHTDYTCLYDGQHIFVGFPRGTIECPPRRLLCGTARPTGRIDTRSIFSIAWTNHIGKGLVALAVVAALVFLAMVRFRLEWLQDWSARANRPPRDKKNPELTAVLLFCLGTVAAYSYLRGVPGAEVRRSLAVRLFARLGSSRVWAAAAALTRRRPRGPGTDASGPGTPA